MKDQTRIQNDLIPAMTILRAVIAPGFTQSAAPLALSPQYSLEMHQKLGQRRMEVERIAQNNQLSVVHMFDGPVFEGHKLYTSPQRDYVFTSMAEDPLWYDPDGFPVPKQILADLRSIKKANLPLDAIYVVHELPKGTVQPGLPVTAEMVMPAPSKEMQQVSKHLGTASHLFWSMVTASLAVTGGLLVAGVLGTAAAATTVVGMDPILLGVAVGKGRGIAPGEPASWYYLGHWVY